MLEQLAEERRQWLAVDATLRGIRQALYDAVKRLGDLNALSREFAHEHSDRLWKQLVVSPSTDGEPRAAARTDAVVAFCLAAAAAAAVKVPARFGLDLDQDAGFHARNASLWRASFDAVRRSLAGSTERRNWLSPVKCGMLPWKGVVKWRGDTLFGKRAALGPSWLDQGSPAMTQTGSHIHRAGPNRARPDRTAALRIATSVCALALAATACADQPRDPAGDASAIRLIPLPPIHGEAIPGQPGFGRIADMEIGDDAAVFVLDELNHAIHAFDDQGVHLRTFGRRGSGPGELSEPVALTWGPDGLLWVVDPGNARYTVFDGGGRLAGTYRHSGPHPVFHVWAAGFSRTGRVAFVTSGPDLLRRDFWLVECEVVDGTVTELERYALDFVEQPSAFVHEGGGSVLVLPIPFSTVPLFRIGPDGELWYGATREPWVRQVSPPDGDERRFGRAFDARRVTRAELDEVLHSADVENLRAAAGPAAVTEFIGMIPDTRPHLEGFFLDDEGHVWLIRAGNGSDATRTIDVYDRTGNRIASVEAALEPEPAPRVRRGLLAGVVRDELGVESIARYRIQR